MRITINGRFLTQPVTGVQRYAQEVVRALDELLFTIQQGVAVRLVVPSGPIAQLKLRTISVEQVGALRGHFWEQLELPVYAANDWLVSLCNAGPILKRRQIVTIHDAGALAFPAAYSLAFRAWYRVMLPLLGSMSRRVITVSRFSEQELIRLCGIAPHKIRVVSEGGEHAQRAAADTSVLHRFSLSDRPYVLAVSSMSIHKNFGALVQAVEFLADPKFNVVVAGGADPHVFAGNKQLPPFVKHVGYVSDGELRALYEHAICFVYPSQHEGFGLPPLEAMTLGCPVVVSDAASLPEVCGDAVVYCNPHDPKDIARKLMQVVGDPELRDSLRQKGLTRASQFSWKHSAREIWGHLMETVDENG